MIVLIGATTENPSFEVIAPLLSRCQVYVLKSLLVNDLNTLFERALKEDDYLRSLDIRVEETEALFHLSGGDARKLLNIIEIVVSVTVKVKQFYSITRRYRAVCRNIVLYDKTGNSTTISSRRSSKASAEAIPTGRFTGWPG